MFLNTQASKTLGIPLGDPSHLPIFEMMCAVVSLLPAVHLTSIPIFPTKTNHTSLSLLITSRFFRCFLSRCVSGVD